jgi:FG-GAP-like repeat
MVNSSRRGRRPGSRRRLLALCCTVCSLPALGLLTRAAAAQPTVCYPAPSMQVADGTGLAQYADLNGDDHIDMVVLDVYSDVLRAFAGRGDGTFSELGSWLVAEDGRTLDVADLNGDDRPDVVLSHGDNADSHLEVRLNQGTGLFPTGAAVELADTPYDVTLGDLEGDGDNDLFVVQEDTDGLLVFLNDGAAAFSDPTMVETERDPGVVEVADLNGDNHLDAVTLHGSRDSLSVLLGYGDGTFEPHVSYSTPDDITGPCVGDLNGDGKPEIVLASRDEQAVVVYANDGEGAFVSQMSYPVGDYYVIWPTLGDINEDGRLDVIVQAGANNLTLYDVAIFLNQGNGGLGPATIHQLGHNARNIRLIDMNRDGHLDMAVTHGQTTNYLLNTVHLGLGDGTFRGGLLQEVGRRPVALDTADLNADGHLDAVVVNAESDDITVLLGQGDGTFVEFNTYDVNENPNDVVIVDITGDGALDLVICSAGGNGVGEHGRVTLFIDMGGMDYHPLVNLHLYEDPVAVTVADFGDDGRLDIAVAQRFSEYISVYLYEGNLQFAPARTFRVGERPGDIEAADLDGDGDQDLVVTSVEEDHVSVLVNYGNDNFAWYAPYVLDGGCSRVALGDVDGDDDTDVLTMATGGVWLLRNNGDTTLAAPELAGPIPNVYRVILHDLDYDGDLDMAGTLGGHSAYALINDGTGAFTDERRYAAGNLPLAVVAGDFDGVGGDDLLVAATDDYQVITFLDRCYEPCPGDLTGDRVIDQQDLGVLLAAYEVSDSGDVNGDGFTDQSDLGILLGRYLAGCW